MEVSKNHTRISPQFRSTCLGEKQLEVQSNLSSLNLFYDFKTSIFQTCIDSLEKTSIFRNK